MSTINKMYQVPFYTTLRANASYIQHLSTGQREISNYHQFASGNVRPFTLKTFRVVEKGPNCVHHCLENRSKRSTLIFDVYAEQEFSESAIWHRRPIQIIIFATYIYGPHLGGCSCKPYPTLPIYTP